MPLKKSAGNMYSWITHTWGPVTGQCGHGCAYCYVPRIARRFSLRQSAPRLIERELKTDLGSGNRVFVCSGCDLFHEDIPWDWIRQITGHASRYPGNTYLWHTKNPGRALEFPQQMFPPDSILCAAIETNRHYPCMGKTLDPFERIAGLSLWEQRKTVTVEPILDFDGSADGFARLILIGKPEQVNIGADSGHNGLPEPPQEKVEELIELLAPHTKVHMKKNLRRLLPEHHLYERAG